MGQIEFIKHLQGAQPCVDNSSREERRAGGYDMASCLHQCSGLAEESASDYEPLYVHPIY